VAELTRSPKRADHLRACSARNIRNERHKRNAELYEIRRHRHLHCVCWLTSYGIVDLLTRVINSVNIRSHS